MQTFLPYPDFAESAYALDSQRLGNQRVENYQILQALYGKRLITSDRIDTGEVRTVYYDPEIECEMEERDLIEGVDYVMTTTKVYKTVDRPRSEWEVVPLENAGWANHPAVRMWRGYEWQLLRYQQAICDEWVEQLGFKDTCFDKSLYLYFRCNPQANDGEMPDWIGNEEFHLSHQSNLIRKDPKRYSKAFPGVPSNLPYVWPVD